MTDMLNNTSPTAAGEHHPAESEQRQRPRLGDDPYDLYGRSDLSRHRENLLVLRSRIEERIWNNVVKDALQIGMKARCSGV